MLASVLTKRSCLLWLLGLVEVLLIHKLILVGLLGSELLIWGLCLLHPRINLNLGHGLSLSLLRSRLRGRLLV